MLQEMGPTIVIVIVILFAYGARVLRENERAVIFRLGMPQRTCGPGIIFVIPLIDRMVRVNLDRQLPGWRGMLKDDLNQKVQNLVIEEFSQPVQED